MKSRLSFILILVATLFASCENDITDMGSTIQPSGDKLAVFADTIALNTESFIVPYMYCRSDSFLIGTYYDETYGTTQADLLTQLQPPLGFSYPEGSKADSAVLALYYDSWAGDDYSPMELSVYQMNKGFLSYSLPYASNINPDDYCDKSILLGKKIFTARDAVVKRNDSTSIELKLSNDFVKSFEFNLSKKYTTNTDFLQQFKGLYITPKFGSAAIMNVNQIDLIYYFHYKYKYAGDTDSTIVKTYVKYPANAEVRQVNRFLHPDTTEVKQKLQLGANNGINYISSPANIYTRVNIPLKSMAQKMTMPGKKLVVNSAMLRVDLVIPETKTLTQNLISKMLIVRESEMTDFFKNRELPSDTLAIVSSIGYEKDDNSEIVYYYSYDLATLIANEISKAKTNNTTLPDNLSLVLVPVSLTYDSNNSITRVQPQTALSAVTIRSGANTEKPMKLKLVYSGF